MKRSQIRYRLMFGESVWHLYTTLEEAMTQREEFLIAYKDDDKGLTFPIFKVTTTTIESEIHI